MGVADLRDAFNLAMGPHGTCITALMEYERAGGTEWQVLYFSGNYPDGTGFSIKSNRVRPGGDILLEAQTTAQTLLKQRGLT